jgi:hypothetical protein
MRDSCRRTFRDLRNDEGDEVWICVGTTGEMAVATPNHQPGGADRDILASARHPVPVVFPARPGTDRRSAPRFALQLLGAVLARGRRTVTSGVRAARLSDQFRPCHTTVAAVGKRIDAVAAGLLVADEGDGLRGGGSNLPQMAPGDTT